MDERGIFAARVLDSGLRSLAASTVVRQREMMAEGSSHLAARAFDDMVGDTEARLLHLCEALATGCPQLFVDQVEWTRSAYAARGVSEDNLALNLLCLRDEISRELPPQTHELVLSVVNRANRAFDHPPRQIGSVLEQPSPHVDLIRRLLLAVLETRRDDALELVLGAVDSGLSVSEVETKVISPLQAEVGRLWQRGELQVHEEHLGSQIVEEALVLLRSRLERGPALGKSVLVCSVVGNLHEIGSRIVADHFEMDGWNTIRLGANLPGQDLSRAVLDFEADLVALSVTMTTQVRNTAAAIEELRSMCGPTPPPILVGGPPFAQVEGLWDAIGADAWALNADGAVSEGRRLLTVA